PAGAADLGQRLGAPDQEARHGAGDDDPRRRPAQLPHLPQFGAAAFGAVHAALHARLGALDALAQGLEPHRGTSGEAGGGTGAEAGGVGTDASSSSKSTSSNRPMR